MRLKSIKKGLVRVGVASTLILGSVFPVTAFAADNTSTSLTKGVNTDVLQHPISKPLNSLIGKKVEENITSSFTTHLTPKLKSSDSQTIYEQEPNDNPSIGEYDTMPLGDEIIGSMDAMDLDWHQFVVNHGNESIFLMGITSDYHTIGFLLYDSNLNLLTTESDIYMDPSSGLMYEVMPNLPQGTYYAVALDITDPQDDISYDYGLYATSLASIPAVNTVREGDSVVTGTADPGDTIYVEDGAQNITNGQVDSNGNFSVPITRQKTGTTLAITAYDPISGSYSNSVSVTVKPAADTTAPASPTVHSITDKDKTISGNAEYGSSITVKNGNAVIGKGAADSKTGNFQLAISPIKGGTVLSVTATDKAGKVSQPTKVTVKDTTAPGAPKVNPIDDNDTAITGSAEAGSKITIKNGATTVGTPLTDTSGHFKFGIKPFKAGTKLTFTATDAAGNVSGAVTVTVADKTPPVKPTVYTVSDASTSVSGKTESGATVTVAVGSKVLKTGKADSKGYFKLAISKQKAGTHLSVFAKDKSGNKSAVVTVTVVDRTPPAEPSVNKVTTKSTSVSGKTEKYATAYLYRGKTYLGKATVSSKGTYSINMHKQKIGTKLSVYAKDKAGNKSKTRTVTVV